MEGFPTFKGSWPWPWVILPIVMHHSSTSTYTPNFILKSKKLFVDGRTDIWDIRSTQKSRPITSEHQYKHQLPWVCNYVNSFNTTQWQALEVKQSKLTFDECNIDTARETAFQSCTVLYGTVLLETWPNLINSSTHALLSANCCQGP